MLILLSTLAFTLVSMTWIVHRMRNRLAQKPRPNIPDDEIEVLRAFFGHRNSKNPAVINEEARIDGIVERAFIFGDSSRELRKLRDDLLGGASDAVPPDLILNFCDTNAWPSNLKGTLNAIGNHIQVFTTKEYEDTFHSNLSLDNACELFHAKFPSSGFLRSSLYTISRVGFDRTHTRAMLYAGCMIDGNAGWGRIYIFIKREGKWHVEDMHFGPEWVS